MPDSLHELFMPGAMAPSVERYADQSEDCNYIGVYEAGEKIEANPDGTFAYDQLDFSRDLAPLTHPDSPSTSTKKLIQSKKTGSVIAVKEHVDLPMRFLDAWRAPGGNMPNAAVQIRNNLRNLTNRAMRTLNFLSALTLLTKNGSIDLSTIPSSQIGGTLVYPVATLDAAASWALKTTPIRSTEINLIRKTYRRNTGFRAGEVIATAQTEGEITGNTEISEFINGGTLGGQILGRSFEEKGVGDVVRLGNLDWLFVEDYYATDAAPQTPLSISPDDAHCAVLPPRARWSDCFAIAEGVEYVPFGSENVGEVIANPSAVIKTMRGWFAYVTVEKAPVGLRLHVGRTFQLVQKMPKSVLVYDAHGA